MTVCEVRCKQARANLRRWNGEEWKRGPVERFAGRRWNGAEWNRLELAKSGPSAADVSLEAASGDSIGGQGFVGSRCSQCLGYFLDADYRQVVEMKPVRMGKVTCKPF